MKKYSVAMEVSHELCKTTFTIRFNFRRKKSLCYNCCWLDYSGKLQNFEIGIKMRCIMFVGLSPDLQSMEQIRRIMRPTDVPDTGMTLCVLCFSFLHCIVHLEGLFYLRGKGEYSCFRKTLHSGFFGYVTCVFKRFSLLC